MRLILLLLGSFWSFSCAGQLNFYRDVSPIIEKRCLHCHYEGGVAPFSLKDYQDVAKRAYFILHVINTGYMPPWYADRNFQSYRNEQYIAPEEVRVIREWIQSGMIKGVPSESRVIERPELMKPDLTLSMTSPYQISGQSVEDYRFFVVPTGLKNDMFLSSIEFIPGNRQQTHHCRVMVDTTGDIRGIDGMSELDSRISQFQKIPLADEFLYGWVPGNARIVFPPGTGKKISKNADLILNMHYSPTSIPQSDQSKVNLYFAKSPVRREVKTLALRENDIVNQPFGIESEHISVFFMNYPITKDISLISVMPHMHLIGKSFIAYAITPADTQIPLIKIDNWDFNWQSSYQFKNLIHLPAGSRLLVQATYDNTSENPENPNQPPRKIGYGWNSTDEMCNLIIYYLDYQPGDESLEY